MESVLWEDSEFMMSVWAPTDDYTVYKLTHIISHTTYGWLHKLPCDEELECVKKGLRRLNEVSTDFE